MPSSTLTSKGQTTIPKRVREHLQLEAGDRVEFIIDADGKVILSAATSDVKALDGLLDRSGQQPVSIKAMHEAVENAVSTPYRKSS